jgi:hypothetical protein
MAYPANLLAKLRPPTPSLDRGPVQRRARRAFIATGKEVLNTVEVAQWTHPRRGTNRVNAHCRLRAVLDRYCERVGRDFGWGRPILWRLRNSGE